MLDLAKLRTIAQTFIEESPQNRIPTANALDPALAGLQMYDAPLLAVGDVNDPLLRALCQPSDAGLIMLPPESWLPGAQSILSLFLPFTQAVRSSNRHTGPDSTPSKEWLHARIEGQAFILQLCDHLAQALASHGHASAIPASDSRFHSEFHPSYTSNWSERHIAHICGLGTFSLSKGLITLKGVAGRFASLITTLPLPPTPRPYTGREDYCTRCGICAINCPAGAISLEAGKDDKLCAGFLDGTRAAYKPYYGCGKCQVDVPCEGCRP